MRIIVVKRTISETYSLRNWVWSTLCVLTFMHMAHIRIKQFYYIGSKVIVNRVLIGYCKKFPLKLRFDSFKCPYTFITLVLTCKTCKTKFVIKSTRITHNVFALHNLCYKNEMYSYLNLKLIPRKLFRLRYICVFIIEYVN